MDFILPFQPVSSPQKISHDQKLMLIGSCFTEEIGMRLSNAKFKVMQNPNGIIYDPLSISAALQSYADNVLFTFDDLFKSDELFHSWSHHSDFSGPIPEEVISKINRSRAKAHDFLRQVRWLFITFGTAYYYKLRGNQQPVANCHKVPSKNFEKHLIEINDAFQSIQTVVKNIHSINPECRIVLTVSPVRHVKDGVIENARSKARLIELCHLLRASDEKIEYFPSYELVIDVLRDYRFFEKDLVHVNDSSVDFIFSKFCDVYFNSDTLELMKEINAIRLAMQHKPFYPESVAHKHFLRRQLQKIDMLQRAHPSIDFSEELEYFSLRVS